MNSLGEPSSSLGISDELMDFLQQMARGDVLQLHYIDLDGEEVELSFRDTKDFTRYFLALSLAVVKNAPQSKTPPKGLKDVLNDKDQRG